MNKELRPKILSSLLVVMLFSSLFSSLTFSNPSKATAQLSSFSNFVSMNGTKKVLLTRVNGCNQVTTTIFSCMVNGKGLSRIDCSGSLPPSENRTNCVSNTNQTLVCIFGSNSTCLTKPEQPATV